MSKIGSFVRKNGGNAIVLKKVQDSLLIRMPVERTGKQDRALVQFSGRSADESVRVSIQYDMARLDEQDVQPGVLSVTSDAFIRCNDRVRRYDADRTVCVSLGYLDRDAAKSGLYDRISGLRRIQYIFSCVAHA